MLLDSTIDNIINYELDAPLDINASVNYRVLASIGSGTVIPNNLQTKIGSFYSLLGGYCSIVATLTTSGPNIYSEQFTVKDKRTGQSYNDIYGLVRFPVTAMTEYEIYVTCSFGGGQGNVTVHSCDVKANERLKTERIVRLQVE